jgi:hypothetical protein
MLEWKEVLPFSPNLIQTILATASPVSDFMPPPLRYNQGVHPGEADFSIGIHTWIVGI